LKAKAIIVDLDRTLLHDDKTISAYTMEVFQKCKCAGIKIMVATSRQIRDVRQYMKLIDFDAVAVTNGAIVICGELITKSTISKSSAERVWRIMCTACDTTVSVEMESGFYANRDIPEWEPIIWKDFNVLPEDEMIYFGDDYDDMETIRMCGVGVAVSNTIEEVKAVADYLAESNEDDGVAKFIEAFLL